MALALALCLAAFAALSVAMERHHAQVFGAGASAVRRQALRVLGWALLFAALWASVVTFGWGTGLVAWCAGLTTAGLLVAWLLRYRAAWLLRVAGCALALAALVQIGVVNFWPKVG